MPTMQTPKGIAYTPIVIMVVSVAAFVWMWYAVGEYRKLTMQPVAMVENVNTFATNTNTTAANINASAQKRVNGTVETIAFSNADLGLSLHYPALWNPVEMQTWTPGNGAETGNGIKIDFNGAGTTSFGGLVQIEATSTDFSVGREGWLGEVLAREMNVYGLQGLCSSKDAWLKDVQSCSVESDRVTMVVAIASLDGSQVLNFVKLVAIKISNPDYPVVGFSLFLPKLNEPTVRADDAATIAEKVSAIHTKSADEESNRLLGQFDDVLASAQFTNATVDWKTYTNTADGISFQYPPTWTVSFEGGETANSNRAIGLRPESTHGENDWSIILMSENVWSRERFLDPYPNTQQKVDAIVLAGKTATKKVITQTDNPSYYLVEIAILGSSKVYEIRNEGVANPEFDTFLSTFQFTE